MSSLVLYWTVTVSVDDLAHRHGELDALEPSVAWACLYAVGEAGTRTGSAPAPLKTQGLSLLDGQEYWRW